MTSLVFIHGFLGTAADWAEVRAGLAFPSTAIEIPEADCWQDGMDMICEHVDDTTILVGYSMGARLAMGCTVALSESSRPRAAIFVSGNPGLSEPERRDRWQHDVRVCEELRNLPSEVFLRRWYSQSVFRALSTCQVDALVESKKTLDIDRQVALMTTYSVAKQPNLWPNLPALKVPVAVVAGERDQKYVDVCHDMHRSITNCEVHVVSDCGHIVHREQPERFATIVNDFATRINEEAYRHE